MKAALRVRHEPYFSSRLSARPCVQAAVASAEATRRKLHNELVEIRGNVGVHMREG